MATQKLGTIETTMLKALSHKDRATISELAAMLPNESRDAIESARAKLEASKLVEPVPGSATGQMRLTSAGAQTAVTLPDDASTGSGGGHSDFS